MRFWIIKEAADASVIGCELSKKAADTFAHENGYVGDGADLFYDVVTCDVNAETVRRLLGNLGGYAK